jgi:hypothetical protein
MPIGSLFYLPQIHGVASTPCSTEPNATTTCTAVVDSKGQLSVSDGDTHKSLNQLQFDSGGNLKTAGQGTSNITGTVSVSNFPATQNVNITGGTVNATQSVASKRVFSESNLGPTHTGHDSFNTINTSFILITTVHAPGMIFTFSGPLGTVLVVNPQDAKSFQTQSFTQRIPINAIEYLCNNIVANCQVQVTLIGD